MHVKEIAEKQAHIEDKFKEFLVAAKNSVREFWVSLIEENEDE